MKKRTKGSEPSEALRSAKERLEKARTYENAVAAQRAERKLRDWRALNLKEVPRGRS